MYPQYGTNDCGLFALAYAIAICEEKDPAKLFFTQIAMRDHFNHVLQSQHLTHFEMKEMTTPHYKEYNVNLASIKIIFKFN